MPKQPEYLQAPIDRIAIRKSPKSDEPTAAFGKLFRGMHELILANYRPETHAWRYGPSYKEGTIEPPIADPQKYLKNLRASPDLEQDYAHEFWTRVAELDRNDWKLEDGRQLYNHQRADIALVPWQLATGARDAYAALLFRNPGGAGKTNEVGEGILVGTRRQTRNALEGIDPGLVVFCTARPTHMASQAFSKEQQIFRSPPRTVEPRHVSGYYRDCRAMFGDLFDQHFPRKIFTACFAQELSSMNGAEILEKVMTEAGTWESFRKSIRMSHEMVQTVISLVNGNKIFLRNIYKIPTLVEPPPYAGKGDADQASYNGDGTRGIRKGTPVLAGRPEWQLEELGEDVDPWVYLTTTATIASKSHSAMTKNAPLLKRTELVGIDEVWSSSPEHIRHAAKEAGAKRPPIILANSAVDNGRHTQWIRGGRKTVPELVEEGVFSNIGYECFPGADGELALPGTEEAWEQFKHAHFRHFKDLDTQKLKQPYHCNSVIIAPTQNDGVREYAHRLQQEYSERNIPVEIFCYDGTAGNERELLELWFKHKGDKPKILVASPSMMQHTVDFQNIENVTVATKLNALQRKGIFERLTHCNLHRQPANSKRSKNEAQFRVYFREQIFANSMDTLVRSLEHEMNLPDENLSWPPLQCLMNENARGIDQKRLSTHHKKMAVRLPNVDERKAQKTADETPLEATSEFVIGVRERRAQRKRDNGGGGNRKDAKGVTADPDHAVRANELDSTREHRAKFGDHVGYPSSEERLKVLALRQEMGLPLWNQNDRK